MAEGPKERRDRFRLLFAASLLTLVLGYWLKVRCLHEPWTGGYEFRHYCFSDTYIHWWVYGFADGAIPYVTHWNEYPALTGTFSWIISLASNDVATWWRLHGLTLLAAALVVTWVLYKMGHDWRSAAPWVFAPTIVMSGFVNYDFWALGFLALGLWFHHERRPWLTGIFLGLGAAAKIFPGLLWPPVAVVLLNEARERGLGITDWHAWRDPAKVTGGFLLGLLPINLLYMAINFDLWRQTWTFQSERTTTYETTFYFLDRMVTQPIFDHVMTAGEMNLLSSLAFFTGSGLLLLAALRRRSTNTHLLALGVLLIYLLTTKVYSSQHGLWILPVIAMARLPHWTWASFSVADVVAVNWLYHFFTPPMGGQTNDRSFEFLPLVEVWVAVRLAILGIILAYVVWRVMRDDYGPAQVRTDPTRPTRRSSLTELSDAMDSADAGTVSDAVESNRRQRPARRQAELP